MYIPSKHRYVKTYVGSILEHETLSQTSPLMALPAWALSPLKMFAHYMLHLTVPPPVPLTWFPPPFSKTSHTISFLPFLTTLINSSLTSGLQTCISTFITLWNPGMCHLQLQLLQWHWEWVPPCSQILVPLICPHSLWLIFCVWHQILLSTLAELGIADFALTWFTSYLTNCTFQVKWNGSLSLHPGNRCPSRLSIRTTSVITIH